MPRLTQAPDTPACEGEKPALFDDWQNPERAIAICETCPVREWCLELLDPVRTHFEGIAGGHAWAGGQHRAGNVFDETLENYLEETKPAPQDTKDKNVIDAAAVAMFLRGELQWKYLNTNERRMAAKHLVASGRMTGSQAAAHCHLNYLSLKSLIGESA